MVTQIQPLDEHENGDPQMLSSVFYIDIIDSELKTPFLSCSL